MIEPSISLFSVFLLLGVAQAVFLSFSLLSANKGNREANRYLAALLLLFGVILCNEFLDQSLYGLFMIQLMVVCFPVDLLLGPLIWFYVLKITEKTGALSSLPKVVHLLPFVINEIAFIPKLLEAGETDFLLTHPEFIEGNQIQAWIISDVFILFAVIQVMLYLVLSLRLLSKHRASIGNQFSYIEGIGLRWLTKLLAILMVLYLLYVLEIVLARQFHLMKLEYADMVLNAGVVLAIYALGFYGIRQSSIFSRLKHYEQPTELIEQTQQGQSSNVKGHKKYTKSSLSQSESERLSKVLLDLMKQDKPYLDSELSLPKLASSLNASTNHVSQVINERFSMKFFDFVNSYRVEEAKRKLVNLDSRQTTILDVALDSGFNSKSAFYAGFKKHTSMTPSEFRKQYST
jgi:AraC-like DNA-binding protein